MFVPGIYIVRQEEDRCQGDQQHREHPVHDPGGFDQAFFDSDRYAETLVGSELPVHGVSQALAGLFV